MVVATIQNSVGTWVEFNDLLEPLCGDRRSSPASSRVKTSGQIELPLGAPASLPASGIPFAGRDASTPREKPGLDGWRTQLALPREARPGMLPGNRTTGSVRKFVQTAWTRLGAGVNTANHACHTSSFVRDGWSSAQSTVRPAAGAAS